MLSLNTQPTEKRDYRADGSLDIVGSPFYTIQGEGPFAGRPAVFVRLAGCNLQCPGCDTDYTTGRKRMGYIDLASEVDVIMPSRLRYSGGLVVVTGGEPFRQNLGPLVQNLLHQDYDVQIETNGTMMPEDIFSFPFGASNLTIVCSPKTPSLNPKLERWIKAYKYVLDAHHVADDGLPLTTLGNTCGVARPHSAFRGEVFVQPADPPMPDKNPVFDEAVYNVKCKENMQAAVQSCLKHGYRLSLQLHKIVEVK